MQSNGKPLSFSSIESICCNIINLLLSRDPKEDWRDDAA